MYVYMGYCMGVKPEVFHETNEDPIRTHNVCVCVQYVQVPCN